MTSDKDIALHQLKKILLSEDEKRLAELENELAALQQQIADKESLIKTLDPVIADVLDRKIVNSRDEFIDIISPIIGGSIKKQVTEAKDDIVDALYPVIGKTIRKSVAEAMKNLVNSVNERIEKSLQSVNIFRIFKSKISGVSQGELVLRHSMPFHIEEMFVIRKENALLIAHTNAAGDKSTVDQDLVSGMIVAIKNFVATAFVKSPDQDLYEIEYGDHNIRLDVQNNFFLAAVIQGVMPNDFPDKLNKLGNRIHNRFYRTIREFDGDPRPLEGCIAMLKSFMNVFNSETSVQARSKSKPILLYFLIVLLLSIGAYVGIKTLPPFLANHRLEKIAQTTLRQDAKAQNESITVSAKDGQLILSGNVKSISQRSHIDSIMRAIPDAKNVVNSIQILKAQTELAKRINQILTPYRTSLENDIRFIIEGDRVILEGYVPNPQPRYDISRIIGELEGVSSVVNNLSDRRQNDTDKLESYLQNNTIYFAPNIKELDESYYRVLDYIAAKMMILENKKLTITGFSDNLASPSYNLKLSQDRAVVVASYLRNKNVADEKIDIQYFGEDKPAASNMTEEGRLLNRRVELTISGS